MAGFGRTGKWFAYQHSTATPDLIVFAKGVNSGYIPLGGVIISDAIAATFDKRVFPGGLTYSGHPIACAAAVAAINAMEEEGIIEHSLDIGEKVIGPGLRKLAEKHKLIGDIRGVGTFWGMDLVTDRATRAPLAPYGGTSPAMGELVAACKSRGLFPFVHFNRMHVVPPCTITADELQEGFAILDQAFTEVGKYYTGN
jgi:taurine--2-oxoglutarate transaminase